VWYVHEEGVMDKETEDKIKQAMADMVAAGYLEEHLDENGEVIVSLTEAGRDYYARLQEHNVD